MLRSLASGILISAFILLTVAGCLVVADKVQTHQTPPTPVRTPTASPSPSPRTSLIPPLVITRSPNG